uniref:Trichoplein keratin filament-binding protein n=1 Tax=Mesocestoides corti TaxID=53468 RepID=A0A5K3ENW7_MESCO
MMPNIRTKNIYEAVMHKQRVAEARRQSEMMENKKFFQDSDVRARQEKRWTSEDSFNNSILAYLQPDKEEILSHLDDRRNKLRALFKKEADFYERSIHQLNESTSFNGSNQYDHLHRLVCKGEPSNSEQENTLIGFKPDKGNYDWQETQQWSPKYQDSGSWDACNNRPAKEELYPTKSESDLNEADRGTKEQKSHKIDEPTEQSLVLQQNLDELERLEAEEHEFELIQKKVIDDQKRLEQVAAERQEIDDSRCQRHYEKVLLRQQTAALKRRSQQIRNDLTRDLTWLSRLQGSEEEAGDGQRVSGPNENDEIGKQLTEVRTMLEEDLRRETRREAYMDEMLASEAAELWKKREQEWKIEEEARQRLLCNL